RPQDRVVEMRIEPEFVDAVIAGNAVSQKVGDGTDLVHQLVAGLVGLGFVAGGAPVLVNLADDGGDLIGRCPGAGFGKQRGMLTRRLGALASAPLRGCTT